MTLEKGPNRKIIISDTINNGVAKEIIQRILDINQFNEERDEKEKNYVAKPIELIINSPGGSVYDGFAIIDIIGQSKTPVNTYCYGRAMSMGLAIFLSGNKRFAGKNCTFMYHDISNFTGGTLEDIKRSVKEMERLSKQYDELVLSKTTNILKETLDGYKVRTENWFINSQDAVKLGIADEII